MAKRVQQGGRQRPGPRGRRGSASAIDAAAEATPAQAERLQKVLANAGLASRRTIESWIAAGRVSVNGQPATLGTKVSPADKVAVDGRAVARSATAAEVRVIALNKTVGTISTRNDPEGRESVFAALPRLRSGRWISIGRLDINTSGLLLFTNDGQLAHRMMHPGTGLDREYAVRVDGVLSDAELASLRDGVMVEGERLAFSDIRYFDGRGRNHWYHVVLMEGKNHEVRRLFGAVGRTVSRLKRVRYGPLILPSWLRLGRTFELPFADLQALYALLNLPLPNAPPAPDRKGQKGSQRATRSLMMDYPALNAAAGDQTLPG